MALRSWYFCDRIILNWTFVIWPFCEGGSPARPEWAARRKFRSGQLGTVHWLARYGYEHRRCEGDAEMRVEGARHSRGAGDVPEDISPRSAKTRLMP